MAIWNAILQPYIFHILRKHNHRGWGKLHVLRRYPFRPRPSPPPCASPYELSNLRANHSPCAERGPERLRVVARGLAHLPPCRYVGTEDHSAAPAKVAAA